VENSLKIRNRAGAGLIPKTVYMVEHAPRRAFAV